MVRRCGVFYVFGISHGYDESVHPEFGIRLDIGNAVICVRVEVWWFAYFAPIIASLLPSA